MSIMEWDDIARRIVQRDAMEYVFDALNDSDDEYAEEVTVRGNPHSVTLYYDSANRLVAWHVRGFIDTDTRFKHLNVQWAEWVRPEPIATYSPLLFDTHNLQEVALRYDRNTSRYVHAVT